VFTRSDLLQEQVFEVKLPVTHWKVLFAVDGSRDADSLSAFLGLSTTDVNRALENLAERQLLNAVDTAVEEKPAAAEEAAADIDTDQATREIEEAFQQDIAQKEEDETAAEESEPDVLEFPSAEADEGESLEIGESEEGSEDEALAEEAEQGSSADEEFDQLIGQLLEEPEEETGSEPPEEKLVSGEEEKSDEAASGEAAVSEEEPKAEGEEDFDFGSLFQEDMAETEQTLTDLMENLEEETETEAAGEAGAEVEAPAPEVRHTLLVVDDSVVIRKMVEIALENENYEIVSVANGKDALKYLDENTPSLVILDIMLPDVNGLDILKAIKASKDIPVVMLSAKDTPRETTKAKELGADDFIPKPFKDEELVSKIRELIGA